MLLISKTNIPLKLNPMQLIAIRNFRNVGRAIPVEKPIHPDHVHVGATFQVGQDPGTLFEKLSRDEKSFVYQLSAANCIGDANDPEVVAAVKREVVAEAKRVAKDPGTRALYATGDYKFK